MSTTIKQIIPVEAGWQIEVAYQEIVGTPDHPLVKEYRDRRPVIALALLQVDGEYIISPVFQDTESIGEYLTTQHEFEETWCKPQDQRVTRLIRPSA